MVARRRLPLPRERTPIGATADACASTHAPEATPGRAGPAVPRRSNGSVDRGDASWDAAAALRAAVGRQGGPVPRAPPGHDRAYGVLANRPRVPDGVGRGDADSAGDARWGHFHGEPGQPRPAPPSGQARRIVAPPRRTRRGPRPADRGHRSPAPTPPGSRLSLGPTDRPSPPPRRRQSSSARPTRATGEARSATPRPSQGRSEHDRPVPRTDPAQPGGRCSGPDPSFRPPGRAGRAPPP